MSDEIETREVRARFVSHHAEGARVHKKRSRQVFNAWHAAELRKAKAAVLRDIAGEFYHWIGLGAVDPVHPGDIAKTLQIRADQIEGDQ